MGVGPRDKAVIEGELRRVPRDLTGIAARCPFGYPVVTESGPVLSSGEPNPTLLYLTCPSLANAVSKKEASGGVRNLRSVSADDPELRALLEEITKAYRERRATLLQKSGKTSEVDPRLGAGIGGPENPEVASCLHAYAAALLAVMSGWLVPEGEGIVTRAHQAWDRLLPSLEKSWCKDVSCAKWDTAQRRAAIDVGTISVRLLVADLHDGRPWTVARSAEVTRLGEGLEPGKRLKQAAKRRTAEVVARYVGDAHALGADTVVIAGTSAARDAADGKSFITRLGKQHSVDAVVLPGEKEARLAYAGAGVDVQGTPVVLDIGGGSTELVVQAGERLWAESFPLGASRATETWIRSDPPQQEEMQAVVGEAERAFGGAWAPYTSGSSHAPRRLVGVAGTITTLAALDAGLTEYDSDAIHLRTLSLESVGGLIDRLASLTTPERAALPCVQEGRASVIVAGALIAQAAMRALGYAELTVSERDLLDGLVMDTAC